MITRCFQELFMGCEQTSSSWRIGRLVFLWKPDVETKKGIKGYRAVALTSVMSKWYATCILSCVLKKEKETMMQLYVGDIDNISCQHLHLLMTQLQKHWESQEDRCKNMGHGSERRPMMYVSSIDIKTTCGVARPKHLSKIMEDQDVHGWIVGALLREMADLEGKATFVPVHEVHPTGKCGGS